MRYTVGVRSEPQRAGTNRRLHTGICGQREVDIEVLPALVLVLCLGECDVADDVAAVLMRVTALLD